MKDESIIRKITALLARADENQNDNENEREIAMRQANYLMAKHDLDLATLSKEQQEAAQGPLYESDDDVGRAIWKVSVYASVAKLHNCTAVKGDGTVHIIGRKAVVQVARSIADWLIQSIEREIPIAWDLVEGKAFENRRSFNTSFGNGASYAIHNSVSKILEERAKGQIGDESLSKSQAMILVNQDKQALAESEDYRSKLYPRLRSSRGSRSGSSKGHAAGRTYGSSLSLNGQLSGNKPAQLR